MPSIRREKEQSGNNPADSRLVNLGRPSPPLRLRRNVGQPIRPVEQVQKSRFPTELTSKMPDEKLVLGTARGETVQHTGLLSSDSLRAVRLFAARRGQTNSGEPLLDRESHSQTDPEENSHMDVVVEGLTREEAGDQSKEEQASGNTSQQADADELETEYERSETGFHTFKDWYRKSQSIFRFAENFVYPALAGKSVLQEVIPAVLTREMVEKELGAAEAFSFYALMVSSLYHCTQRGDIDKSEARGMVERILALFSNKTLYSEGIMQKYPEKYLPPSFQKIIDELPEDLRMALVDPKHLGEVIENIEVRQSKPAPPPIPELPSSTTSEK